MASVTVYKFQVWDRDRRTNALAPQMAIAATIRRMKGDADLESALEVDEKDIDQQGFYSKQPEQKTTA